MPILPIGYKKHLWLIIFYVFLLLISSPAHAQYFGSNKIQYKKIDFKLLETPHFSIYNYFKDDSVTYNLADITELWYKHHSSILKTELSEKNPVILYANHADFSQTTLSPENIGVGTGGITEGLKNRIFMPVFESKQQTKHVIGHELVHAFQYDILKNTDSITIAHIQNIPLWMIEGMAEYMSKGSIDTFTAMKLRDSYINNSFPSIKDLNNMNKYFPYTYGQAFWAFITANWSDDIIKPLLIATAKYGYSAAFERILSCKEKELSEMWLNQIKHLYDTLSTDTIKIIGKEILHKDAKGDINITPNLSPDGKYIAFLNEKDAISIDLYIAETQTGKIIRKLSQHTEKSHVDEYNFIEDIGSWSPDGNNYIYTVFSKGKTALIIVDIHTGETIDEIFIKDLPFFSHPTYSPDGNKILLTSIKDGKSNLYIYTLKEQTITQLTFDSSSKIQTNWSPDGKKIIFASDNITQDTILEPQKFKTNILSLENNTIETIDILDKSDNLNALFSSDGKKIYFLSNFNGFRNLYEYNLNTKETFQLTKYFTGISGITELSNAISLASKDDLITYILFKNDQYILYAAKAKDFPKYKIDDQIKSNNQAAKISIEPSKVILQTPEENLEELHNSYHNTPYKPKFSFTALSQSAGIGIGTSAATTIAAAGNIDALFSDILDRHQLLLSVGVNGELYDLGGGLFYTNKENRLNWQVGLAHSPYLYSYLDSKLLNANTRNTDKQIAYDYYKLRIFEETIGGSLLFPIFRSLRLEAGAKLALQNYRVDRLRDIYEAINKDGSYYPGSYIRSETSKLSSQEIEDIFKFNPKSIISLSSYIAYVGDNSIFGLTSPIKGHRYRFEIGKTFIDINSINLLADYRKYFFIKPLTLAFKGIYIGRFGTNQYQTNLLYIGYDEFVRGYYSLYTYSGENTDILDEIQKLTGSQLANSSIEIRMPFTGPKRLALIESKLFFTDLVLFFDSGLIWGKANSTIIDPGYHPVTSNLTYSKARFISSTGISLRFNLFGIAILEPYYALPFNHSKKTPKFGFFISSGGW